MKGSIDQVKNITNESTADIEINCCRQLSLNCDVAYQRRTGGQSNFLLGRIQRMVKSGKSRGKIEYKKPVDLNNEKDQAIILMIVPYR